MSLQHDRRHFQSVPFCTGEAAQTLSAQHAEMMANPKLMANLRAVAATLAEDQAKKEPVGEWMRENGCPPEEWVLFLPESMRQEIGPYPPNYVRYSRHLEEAFVLRAEKLYEIFGVR